jgi:hypothetical protein
MFLVPCCDVLYDFLMTVMLWKKSYIDLSIERLDIVLSDFCPDIYPWADIAVALPVFTYGKQDCPDIKKKGMHSSITNVTSVTLLENGHKTNLSLIPNFFVM